MCLELLLELADRGEADGPLVDLGTGSGLLAIAAAKLGWSPVMGTDREEAAIEAAAANAAANGVSIDLELGNLREGPPPLAATTVANLTASVLRDVARRFPAPSAGPRTLVLSGLLPAELDEIADAFAAHGLSEAESRLDGDWAALLLRRR